ncbi:MAG TPA: N-acetylmuramoyl-L-alanine amidase [Longimicrobiaceae bacterium]|nr:N-acetylmuramoyl-L-alanine amidase [Longimicrobiaceae bacterium]
MKIVNHLLVKDDGTPYPFVRTPNVSANGVNQHRYLVMHFTAGSSAKESITWLADPQAKASAHLVIGKDGSVTQMVAFNKVAWHAGKSTWEGIDGLNTYSIGIELDNPGRLTRKGDHWAADFGGSYKDADVIQAVHKNETKSSGWFKYPQAQMDVAREIATLLVKTYGIKEVIGHEDISPGRKVDPGPAFPMDQFRAEVMLGAGSGSAAAGAAQPSAASGFFKAKSTLNIRSAASTDAAPVAGSPLPPGTLVQGLADNGGWKQVAVQGSVNGASGVRGWVSAQYLDAATTALPDRPADLALADSTGSVVA